MDDPLPLSPNKMQRLMYFAQDKTLNTANDGASSIQKPSSTEPSSGLSDLDKGEGFGESGVGSQSICMSRDPTADEASLVPFSEIDMSMKAYFNSRCQKLDEMLPRNDSPQNDRSMEPSSAEDSLNMNRAKDLQVNQAEELILTKKEPNLFQTDMTLDSVPVSQPRVAKVETIDKGTFVPISPKENRPLMGPPASAIRPQTPSLLDPCRAHPSNPLLRLDSTFQSEDDESLSLSKIANILGPWAEIQTSPVKGFVGVSTPATISIRSLTDSWLMARLEFHQQRNDVTIDLPRFPLLLEPGRTEHCIVQVTSNVRTIVSLQFTLYLKDSSIDGEKVIEGAIEVDVQMPTIQAIASAGVNRVSFPLIPEGKSLTRTLVLVSDCSVDLQLQLSVKEGARMFTINHIQEIKKIDIAKELIDHAEEKQQFKTKGLSKQLCRLSSGNSIKVSLTFAAPKMTQLNLDDTVATVSGCLDVILIGINAVIKKIDLTASVGKPKLAVILDQPTVKLHLGNEVANLTIANTGSVTGTWLVRFRDVSTAEQSSYPFRVSASHLEIEPGHSVYLKLAYTQPEDCFTEGALIFEEVLTGNRTALELTGGKYKGKPFPVKVNCAQVSWVRPGRKEISLKNTTDKKLHIKCRIMGEGFHIDSANAGVNSGMIVTIDGNECRPLPVVFQPSSEQPWRAALYMAIDNESHNTRKVILMGCACGEALRWRGMVTYGDTALVAAVPQQPVQLKLVNKSHAPAFVAARVHFKLHFQSVAATSRLEDPHRVVPGKGSVTLTLHVDWPRVERRARTAADCVATALATVTVLTGAEYTRRRILKVLKQSSVGSLDVSLLPAHLQALVGPFAGEDPNLDHLLRDFDEPKTSLAELVSGVQELSAQIDLSQDSPEETTILITDDTVVDHHTLVD